MFERIPSLIHGCFVIKFRYMTDNRGSFTKTFHQKAFTDLNYHLEMNEEYYSQSKKGVFRGMHFQTPPMAVDKLVFCVYGQVKDYVFDLRKSSPTFGQYQCFELNSETPSAVFMPIGLAHGFYATSEVAIMNYKTSQVYDPICDTGIDYRSMPFASELKEVIVSERDLTFEKLNNFINPFV